MVGSVTGVTDAIVSLLLVSEVIDYWHRNLLLAARVFASWVPKCLCRGAAVVMEVRVTG